MEQRYTKKSNLGELQDDVDNERELLRQQREEVAMLKEQLQGQVCIYMDNKQILQVCFADMIFLHFKAEFRYPKCPIQLKIYLVRFSCNFGIHVRFRILQCKVSFLWADQVPA